MEHMLHYLYIPGKIEDALIIIDFNKLGLTKLPGGALKEMVDCLQNAYKGRLFKMFIVNATTILKILWGILAGFMDPNTRAKMQVFSSNNPPELTNLVMPSQLFKEFGGEAEPPAKYWPPIFPPGFREEFETKHLTKEEFKEELLAKVQMVPSPELAQIIRDSRKGKGKKGVHPRKNYRLKDRIERRDSFNGVIPDEQPRPESVVEPSSVILERCFKPLKQLAKQMAENSHLDGKESGDGEEKAEEEKEREEVHTDNDKNEQNVNNVKDCADIKLEATNIPEAAKEIVIENTRENGNKASAPKELKEEKADDERGRREEIKSRKTRSATSDNIQSGCKCIVI
eukprot:TRINITY_DN10055_c0_g1_i4.p1 TRINITY_DN10055_c0_g1~~TRINITY_DN10055_c0_g1_i4.p1  ORF type:complete len:342 (-),score=116.40 TRINITY_DN10055_c0_g1_i4:92-1117(-)